MEEEKMLYCDGCHLALGSQEEKIALAGKVYHFPCFYSSKHYKKRIHRKDGNETQIYINKRLHRSP